MRSESCLTREHNNNNSEDIITTMKCIIIILSLIIYVSTNIISPSSLMTAVIQQQPHGPLVVSNNVPIPEPGDGEVLIRVHYSALNRMDLLQAKGKYPLPEGTSDILGVEVCESCYIAIIVSLMK